jgi:pimeloyl-ACP methyl ester carboxylesterase
MPDQYLPIIYVRGFAGGTGGINNAADDPFYGFNAGSTHIRVGSGGTPRFYQFESPLLRLIMDHGYRLEVNGGQAQVLAAAGENTLNPRTIWIYRFYDASADTFGVAPQPFEMEAAAQGLRDFIHLVLAKTRDADQLYLVAHSMGGLVCRSAIQRYMTQDSSPFPVSKVVTYATPHGGIDIELGGPVIDWIIGIFGPAGSEIFQERRMRQYLMPEDMQDRKPRDADWDPREPYTSRLQAERYLSLVGTNSDDFGVAAGLSSLAVGVKSDGLVQIRNAYVKGSNRAYMHRSHSGRYGIVNSEEGYQNLQRFLFGNLKITLWLTNLELDVSDGTVWQADVALAIRGLSVLLHQQSAAHHCPVMLSDEAARRDTADSPVPLITTFLLPVPPGQTRRYAFNLRVLGVRQTADFFVFKSHLEQIADWEDSLIVDVDTGIDEHTVSARWQWNSTLAGPIAEAKQLQNELDVSAADDHAQASPGWSAGIRLPATAQPILGRQAGIRMDISAWQ